MSALSPQSPLAALRTLSPRSALSLLVLAACGGIHQDRDLDPDLVGDGVAGGRGEVAIPDGGEGLTVDPVDGSLVAGTGTGAGAEPDDARLPRRFPWDELAGPVALSEDLASSAVQTSRAGPWTSRSAGYGGGADLAGATRRGGGAVGAVRRAIGGVAEAMDPSPRPVPAHAAAAPVAEPEADMALDEGGMGGMGGMGDRTGPAAAGPLRAGSTDDNADLPAFERYVAEWTARGVGQVDTLDVSDARTLLVRDGAGRPVPGAQVSVVDRATDRLVWTGTTYGDGSAPFYPHLRHGLLGEADVHGGAGWAVSARLGDTWTTRGWDGEDETLSLTLDVDRDGPVALDVVFLIDTTGSMSDEIDRIKGTLLSTTAKLRGLDEELDLRYGAVLYRDLGDEYVTRAHPLTGDIQGFDHQLQAITAGGGGDGPESLNQGLAVAVGDMDWREGAARLVFLVADAPPHMDYQGDTTYGRSSLAALHRGIRLHTVAASGLTDQGSLVFRQTAQLGQGRFIFIEYGSAAASAADHGVSGPVASNNLDDIIYREIKGELEGWGQPAAIARR